MSLKRRIEKLEGTQSAGPCVPFAVELGGPDGVEVEGRFLTWQQYERAYPELPKPLCWSNDPRFAHRWRSAP